MTENKFENNLKTLSRRYHADNVKFKYSRVQVDCGENGIFKGTYVPNSLEYEYNTTVRYVLTFLVLFLILDYSMAILACLNPPTRGLEYCMGYESASTFMLIGVLFYAPVTIFLLWPYHKYLCECKAVIFKVYSEETNTIGEFIYEGKDVKNVGKILEEEC